MQERFPDRPKCLIPVAGKAFLRWQLDWLIQEGITGIHLAAGYLADRISDWIGDLCRSDEFQRMTRGKTIQLTVGAEPRPLGTGGGLRYAIPHIKTDPFFVINGDTLVPSLSFESMLELHRSSACAIMALAKIEQAGRYGVVEFDDAHRITAFHEKQFRHEAWVNAGVYLLDLALVANGVEPDRKVSLETDVFPRLAATRKIRAHLTRSLLLDMGTTDGLDAMERFLDKNRGLTAGAND